MGSLVTWGVVVNGAVLLNLRGERFGNELVGYSKYARNVSMHVRLPVNICLLNHNEYLTLSHSIFAVFFTFVVHCECTGFSSCMQNELK